MPKRGRRGGCHVRAALWALRAGQDRGGRVLRRCRPPEPRAGPRPAHRHPPGPVRSGARRPPPELACHRHRAGRGGHRPAPSAFPLPGEVHRHQAERDLPAHPHQAPGDDHRAPACPPLLHPEHQAEHDPPAHQHQAHGDGHRASARPPSLHREAHQHQAAHDLLAHPHQAHGGGHRALARRSFPHPGQAHRYRAEHDPPARRHQAPGAAHPRVGSGGHRPALRHPVRAHRAGCARPAHRPPAHDDGHRVLLPPPGQVHQPRAEHDLPARRHQELDAAHLQTAQDGLRAGHGRYPSHRPKHHPPAHGDDRRARTLPPFPRPRETRLAAHSGRCAPCLPAHQRPAHDDGHLLAPPALPHPQETRHRLPHNGQYAPHPQAHQRPAPDDGHPLALPHSQEAHHRPPHNVQHAPHRQAHQRPAPDDGHPLAPPALRHSQEAHHQPPHSGQYAPHLPERQAHDDGHLVQARHRPPHNGRRSPRLPAHPRRARDDAHRAPAPPAHQAPQDDPRRSDRQAPRRGRRRPADQDGRTGPLPRAAPAAHRGRRRARQAGRCAPSRRVRPPGLGRPSPRPQAAASGDRPAPPLGDAGSDAAFPALAAPAEPSPWPAPSVLRVAVRRLAFDRLAGLGAAAVARTRPRIRAVARASGPVGARVCPHGVWSADPPRLLPRVRRFPPPSTTRMSCRAQSSCEPVGSPFYVSRPRPVACQQRPPRSPGWKLSISLPRRYGDPTLTLLRGGRR